MPNNPLATPYGPISVQIAETDVEPVTAGGDKFGWVIGSPLGLAAGATQSAIFDLGPLWFRYPVIALCMVVANSIGLQYVMVSSSDTPTFSITRRLRDLISPSPGMIYTSVTVGVPINIFARPMGRYIAINFNNADTIVQGAGAKVTLAAYPS